MRPLATDGPGMTTAAPAAAALPRVRVLPRFLRRPARALLRRQWRLPQRFGLKAFLVFAIVTVIAGAVTGGRALSVVSAVSAWSGLAITEVKITGQSETSELAVLDRLDIKQDPSLLTFDVDAARARVALLPWVDHATLKKLFPNTLEVIIAERTPFAIWQHGGALSLVDASGKVITNAIDERYAHLPFVAGPGAGTRARAVRRADRWRAGYRRQGAGGGAHLRHALERRPRQRRRGDAARRQAAAALATVATLDAEKRLLSREITAGRHAAARPDDRAPGRAGARRPQGPAQGAREARAPQRTNT